MDDDVAQPEDAGYFDDEIATFGDRVAAAREVMGLSRAQLAERIGIKERSLANWEEDRSEPRANKLQMLAGILNVSMIWLMTGVGEGVEPGTAEEIHTDDILLELRAIRTESVRLSERLGRLEKRLRGVM